MSDEPKLTIEDNEKKPLENSKMTITIEIERFFDPKRKKNNLMMTMGAADFTDENDKDVGSVLHGVPAHTIIRDKETGEDWLVNHGVLFTAYMKAREEFEKEEEEVEILKPDEWDHDNEKLGC